MQSANGVRRLPAPFPALGGVTQRNPRGIPRLRGLLAFRCLLGINLPPAGSFTPVKVISEEDVMSPLEPQAAMTFPWCPQPPSHSSHSPVEGLGGRGG